MWRVAERIAAEHGVVATAYEQRHGRFSRVHQCALAYLFTPSTDIYSCPLAMTDGAARTLLIPVTGPDQTRCATLYQSRPKEFWTSGQWMTELTGGSDVGPQKQSRSLTRLETLNPKLETGVLYGRKWFTSAATSQIALTLARPEGNPAGGRGLALSISRCG